MNTLHANTPLKTTLFFCDCIPANLRIAGALEKSTQVMNSMQQLVKVPEVMATMREMSKEMMKVSYWCGEGINSGFLWLENQCVSSILSSLRE